MTDLLNEFRKLFVASKYYDSAFAKCYFHLVNLNTQQWTITCTQAWKTDDT